MPVTKHTFDYQPTQRQFFREILPTQTFKSITIMTRPGLVALQLHSSDLIGRPASEYNRIAAYLASACGNGDNIQYYPNDRDDKKAEITGDFLILNSAKRCGVVIFGESHQDSLNSMTDCLLALAEQKYIHTSHLKQFKSCFPNATPTKTNPPEADAQESAAESDASDSSLDMNCNGQVKP